MEAIGEWIAFLVLLAGGLWALAATGVVWFVGGVSTHSKDKWVWVYTLAAGVILLWMATALAPFTITFQ